MASDLSTERSHLGDGGSDWVESWLFDVVHHDASIALSIEFLLWPQHRRVAFHASVLRTGHPLVSLVELDATAPKPPSLEVRAPGLWADIGIQTPLDHMTVDIEAFAVALDDPEDVFDGAYGIRTALGCELEWESEAEARAGQLPQSYEIPCTVHGELLLDEETIEIDGWGWRSHRWGAPTIVDRTRMRGRASDGTWIHDHSSEWEVTMEVLAAAPVPDPSTNGRLQQFFARNDAGDFAWIRRPT